MDATKILGREEMQAVLDKLHRAVRRPPSRRPLNKYADLIVFRLSACCGLRCVEICGLNVGDMIAGGDRPILRIRKEITKGQLGKRKARKVPLWWDSGTFNDLRLWRELRLRAGASLDDPFVCSCQAATLGKRLEKKSAARRWRTSIGVLGAERRKQLSIHCGRHSFISHALYCGRSLVEVRDAAGHASVNTTSLYLHLIERENVRDLFDFSQPNGGK